MLSEKRQKIILGLVPFLLGAIFMIFSLSLYLFLIFCMAFFWHFVLCSPTIKEKYHGHQFRFSFLGLIIRLYEMMESGTAFSFLPQWILRLISPLIFMLILVFVTGNYWTLLACLAGSIVYELSYWVISFKRAM